tara:strand:+ start:34583 stop:35029 length:447 start_codon:yes stop_codon:yes gene_type:complete
MIKKTERPINELIRIYENNYIKILKILSDLDSSFSFIIKLPEGKKDIYISIDVNQHSRHTSFITITREGDIDNNFQKMHLEIVVYKDLKLAEIKKFNGISCFWLRLPFPNKNMLNKDDKFQQNIFLSELLDFVIKEGMVEVNIESLMH